MVEFIIGFIIGLPVGAWCFKYQYSSTKVKSFAEWQKVKNYVDHLHDYDS